MSSILPKFRIAFANVVKTSTIGHFQITLLVHDAFKSQKCSYKFVSIKFKTKKYILIIGLNSIMEISPSK